MNSDNESYAKCRLCEVVLKTVLVALPTYFLLFTMGWYGFESYGEIAQRMAGNLGIIGVMFGFIASFIIDWWKQ